MKSIDEMKTLDRVRENYVPEKVERLSEEEMQWFRDAKFGMFIHWGLYSLLGKGEWVLLTEKLNVKEYEKLAGDFSALEFNAKEWAHTAKAAGMKYMVLTTRHHDGFCLFDSKASSFNSMNAAAHKDFVREFVEACRNEGLKVGFYYSPLDWRFPGYFFPEMFWENAMELKKQCWEQLRELMTDYGKIDMLWFDGEWLALGGIDWDFSNGWCRKPDWTKGKFLKVNYFWESEKLVNMIRELQPGIMINNRGGWEGDFHVRERRIDGIRTDKPWDSNDCIADSWGYMPDKPVLSLAQLIKNIVAIVTRDGNYLLNVGPMGNGRMDEEQVERLMQLGKWMEKYEESIYNTRGGPVMPGLWGGSVYRGKKVYLHITSWEKDRLIFPNPGKRLTAFYPLNVSSVSVKEKDGSLEVEVPMECRDPYDTIICLEYEDEIRWEGVKDRENDVYGESEG